MVASDAVLQMQQNLRGCSIVFIAAASPRALIPALFNRVIVDGDLVVVVLLLLFHNKRVFKSLIFTNFIFNALRVDHVTMNWQESFEKWNWLAIYITFVVAKRW